MSGPALREVLDAIASAGRASPEELATIARSPDAVVDEALAAFAAERGADALPALAVLTGDRADRGVRRAARRALYRLAQRGITPPPTPGRRVVERQAERAVRAWISAIDGSGSRATWVLFEGAYGGLKLCSLIVNDEVGIVEVAGGDITKKRLDRELQTLRAEQKLPWIEVPAGRALAIVTEALDRHRALGTAPPADFERWRPLVEAGHADAAIADTVATKPVDDAALARSTELLELPDMAGWFIDPDSVQADALEVLQTRESRLVVSEQIKTEREDAILVRVMERTFTPEARARWARRLSEMAWIFDATERGESARLARAASAAFADLERDVTQHPLARAMTRRALELAGEVALGRVNAADVSRKPTPTRESPPTALA
jgi:hypothetical protein